MIGSECKNSSFQVSTLQIPNTVVGCPSVESKCPKSSDLFAAKYNISKPYLMACTISTLPKSPIS